MNARPATPASCAARATFTSGTAVPAMMRVPSTVDVVEASAEPHHDARHAAVAHDQVRAEADDRDRNVGGQHAEEIRQVGLVLRHEQHLRRPADAEPGQFGERLVRQQPAAQLGRAGFQVRSDIREAHQPSAFNSPSSE